MAKLEEPQDIPSELLDGYRGALNAHPTGSIVKKRYPYRMPPMQQGGKGVYPKQRTQRARFKEAIQNFKGLSQADRARWYAAEPPWGSFLWYYNYFIMSSLAGNANAEQGGFGVIKTIQFVSKSIPIGGNEPITIATVDPTKTVVMVFGNSYISDRTHHYDGIINDGVETTINLSPNIDPNIAEVKITGGGGYTEPEAEGHWGDFFITSISATQVKVKIQNLVSPAQFGYSLDIIEHKSQPVYPYILSIGANEIRISWPITPSVAAVIGATVIEYI